MKVVLELNEQQLKDLNREIEKSNRKYEKRNNGVLIGSIYLNVTDKRGYDYPSVELSGNLLTISGNREVLRRCGLYDILNKVFCKEALRKHEERIEEVKKGSPSYTTLKNLQLQEELYSLIDSGLDNVKVVSYETSNHLLKWYQVPKR